MLNRARLLVVIQFAILGVMLITLITLTSPPDGVNLLIGGGLLAGGVVLALLSIAEHARINQQAPNVTPTPYNRQLVMSGPYTRVRHPIYTGVMMAALGVTIGYLHPLLLAEMVALYILFSIKARYEEQLLQERYPQYADYVARSGRFIPFVNL